MLDDLSGEFELVPVSTDILRWEAVQHQYSQSDERHSLLPVALDKLFQNLAMSKQNNVPCEHFFVTVASRCTPPTHVLPGIFRHPEEP